jgi:hypothetical protein
MKAKLKMRKVSIGKVDKPIPDPLEVKRKVYRKPVVPRPFKEMWPRILTFMMENPKATYPQIWKEFHPKIDDVFNIHDFKALIKKAGLTKQEVKEGTSLKAEVRLAMSSFADSRKEYAERHMQRIHKKLEVIHEVVDKLEVDEKNVGRALGLVSQLHKEGRIAYGIDEESRSDQKVTNLAVMIGFEPKVKDAKVIDVP